MTFSSRQITLGLAGVLIALLCFLAGYLEGMRRSPLGEPLRLVRDEDDASCLALINAKLETWKCPAGR